MAFSTSGWMRRHGTGANIASGSIRISIVRRVAKADPLDGEVVVQERQLFGQRNPSRSLRVERQSQQIPEMLDHAARQPRIPLHL